MELIKADQEAGVIAPMFGGDPSDQFLRGQALLLGADHDRGAVGILGAYEAAVIAWAVFPTVPEALPSLYAALGGPGRPVGVLACRPCPQGAIIEWDPDSGGIEIIMRLVDVELRRFCSGRRAELLSPLTPRLSAKIAASGMSAPEIAADRILELLIDA